MKTIIAGPRNFSDQNEVNAAIAASSFDITVVVSGMAAGVDTCGEVYAFMNGIKVKHFPVQRYEWKEIGKTAGFRRTDKAIQFSDALIALWRGVRKGGTYYTIEAAKAAGLEIFVWKIG